MYSPCLLRLGVPYARLIVKTAAFTSVLAILVRLTVTSTLRAGGKGCLRPALCLRLH